MQPAPTSGIAVLSTPRCEGNRAAAALWTSSVVLLAAMPVGMAIAHRSSPLVAALAAVAAIGAAMVEGRGEVLARELGRALTRPLGIAATAFLAWAGLSILWSEHPGTSLHTLGEFVLACAASFVLAVSLPGRAPRFAAWLLATAVVMACASMLVEIGTGLALRRAVGARFGTYIFNRPVLTNVLLMAPLACALVASSRRNGLLAAAATFALVALTAAVSDSGAAVLALAVLIGTAVLAWAAPRLMVTAGAATLVAAVAVAPLAGELADQAIPQRVHSDLARSHTRDRVDIWLSFGAAIRAAPIIGSGFGASAKLDTSTVAASVAPEFRSLLAAGHPHNAALQIWTEVGAVGAFLALGVLLLALRSLAELRRRLLAPALAVFAAAAAVSLVGHGAWQGWWATAIGAATVWFRVAARKEHAP